MSDPLPRVVPMNVPPPDASARYVHIITPIPAAPIRLIILARSAVGCLTHWVKDEKMKGGGRTVPHSRPDDTCPICVESNQKPRWHGYIACWWEHSTRYVVADITVHAVQTCPALAPASGVDLRGRSLILRRVGKSRNSPVAAELSQDRRSEEGLAATFDVTLALLRIWGQTSTKLWRFDDLEGR